MTAKRLGVGFIGAGFITNFHIRSFAGVRDADIRGIVSRTNDHAEQSAALAKSIGVGDPVVYERITDMVADPQIDAIWICAPNHTRIENMEEIADAIRSGKGELIGVACEKPLGRNLTEAHRMRELAREASLLDGYLEDQIFAPSFVRGHEIIWARGAAATGRPYLARAAEEHGGPHMPWFWEGELQGGGVLNDMMCHSVEVARHLLTPPGESRDFLIPVKLSAYTTCLKWQRSRYAEHLAAMSGGTLDYLSRPAEDFARSLIEYRDRDGERLVVETSTSWCYVGAGLRLSIELLGPEYSMTINSLSSDLNLFFSRNVRGATGEDLVEKQNAETGLMPVVSDEAAAYGYEGENRHMVRSFLAGERPAENFDDGVAVTGLLMAAYKSAEEGRTLELPISGLETFVPEVARGVWNPARK